MITSRQVRLLFISLVAVFVAALIIWLMYQDSFILNLAAMFLSLLALAFVFFFRFENGRSMYE